MRDVSKLKASEADDPAEGSPKVVVCGAGAAGMAAALSAAQAGASVQLIEAGQSVGGTMADALLHTLAGLYDSRGEYVNDGLAKELAERLMGRESSVKRRRMGRVWVLTVDPDLYRAEVESWVRSEPRIRLALGTRVSKVEHRASNDEGGRRIVELELEGPEGVSRLAVCAVIDATGRGDVVRRLDPKLHSENPVIAAGGWVFRMRGVAPSALAFPKGAALLRSLREAVERGELTTECEKAWVDTGVYEDEVFVKLFIPLELGWREREASGEIARGALKTQELLAKFLQTLPGFADAHVTQTSRLGVRDGGRVEGEYTLTRADVLELRRFEDPACRCAWPIEYWDSKSGVSLEYLPDAAYYEIPMQSLKVRSVQNLWVAGKCLSADRFAQASARCVGTCWAMGEAVGRRAANAGEGSSKTLRQGAP